MSKKYVPALHAFMFRYLYIIPVLVIKRYIAVNTPSHLPEGSNQSVPAQSSGTHTPGHPHKSSGTHTPSHLVPEGSTVIIRYSHSMSSGTHTPCHPYSSISSGTSSTHPVLECSRNHPVPECSRSSGTSINNSLVLEIIQKFEMLLEENRGHGFCPERRLHANMCVIIHPYHTCGPPSQGE
jgi:hypothetical protein